jgi:hypothetical protein
MKNTVVWNVADTMQLAAFTFWYEFYYEIYPHRFQYVWKIKQLHEEYGKPPQLCTLSR